MPGNADLVRRLFDAFNRSDTSGAGELWTPDCEWRPAYFGGGLLEGTVYRGHRGVSAFIDRQAEVWASFSAGIGELWEAGDRVVVEVHITATGRASGVAVDEDTWNVFTCREGRIAAGRVYTTRAEAFEAAGLAGGDTDARVARQRRGGAGRSGGDGRR